MTDRNAAVYKAQRTAKWATTMTRWLITKTPSRTNWQLVAFPGRSGSESAGILDILAMRKDHGRTGNDGLLKRGDLFEIFLIQVKGGTASWPSWNDVDRLRAVARHHRAKGILLAVWKKGRQPTIYSLKRRGLDRNAPARTAWQEEASPEELFR